MTGARLVPDVEAALAEAEVDLVCRTRLLDAEDVLDFAAYRERLGETLPALIVVAEQAPRNVV